MSLAARMIALFAEAGVVWNSADKSGNITLSSSDETASGTGPLGSVRGTVSKSAGQWTFEVLINAIGNGNGLWIGIGNASMSLASYVGADAHGYGYRNNGERYNNAVATSGYGVMSNGDVITVYYNASKVWWALNGVVQGGGDPVAGTGGVAVTAGAYFPAFAGDGSTPQASVTLRAPIYNLTGFNPWAG